MQPEHLATLLSILATGQAMPGPAPALEVADALATPAVIHDAASGAANATLMAAGIFTAYSGDHCDSGKGGDVGFSTAVCIGTPSRHSFRVSGCTAQVLVWDKGSCGGTWKTYTVGSGGCQNVNTGLNWQSATAQCI